MQAVTASEMGMTLMRGAQCPRCRPGGTAARLRHSSPPLPPGALLLESSPGILVQVAWRHQPPPPSGVETGEYTAVAVTRCAAEPFDLNPS